MRYDIEEDANSKLIRIRFVI